MPGTGITLSERFGGLQPWKLSSVEEEFGHKPSSAVSLSDILKLKTLAITVDAVNKSGNSTDVKSNKYTTSCLHKLFSQKSTRKEVKTDGGKKKKRDSVVKKKSLPQTDADKSKSEKQSTVKYGDKLKEVQAHAAESKSDSLPNGSGSPQKGPVTSSDRPRDPRLLYGRGSYSTLAKKSESVTKPDASGSSGKSQSQESITKCIIPNKPDNSKYPIKKQKRSFGESLTSGNGIVLEAARKKSDGDKTIQVVKRNAVTKQITGVVQMNAKRKPLQTTDQNKPTEASYQSSHNALQRIAEAKKTEEAAQTETDGEAVATPHVLKSILKNNTTSVDKTETIEKPQKSEASSSEVDSISQSGKSEEDKPLGVKKKRSAQAKKRLKGKRKGSIEGTKLKSSVRNKKVPKTTKEANIVVKLSILPTIDNGKLNLTLVSSSEDDQEKPGSKALSGQSNLKLSNQPKDERIELSEPSQITVTDEELKKGSPIEVHISNGINSHSPKKSASLNKLDALISGENSVADVGSGAKRLVAPTNLSEDGNTSIDAFGSGKDISSIGSANIEAHPWISDKADGPRTGEVSTDSGCLYTIASNASVVSALQSVVEVNQSRPIPISYMYGTVAASNKVQESSPTPSEQCQSSCSSGSARSPAQPFSPTMQHVMQADASSTQSSRVTVTGSSTNEHDGVSVMPGYTSSKTFPSIQHITDCKPISVVIQQNPQKVHKTSTKENISKPLHRTLTAIARASETQQPVFAGSDNFDVVDMDLSTPSRCAANDNITETKAVPDASQIDSAESSNPASSSLTLDEGQNAQRIEKNSHISGENRSENINLSERSEGDGQSQSEEQTMQVSHWTTYLHEDTNSPLKSAFGSKQLFTEALSSLQETMQQSDETASPESLKEMGTSPIEKAFMQKISSASSVEPTRKVDATKEKSLLKETIKSSEALLTIQNVDKMSAPPHDSTCLSDIPRSGIDTANESSPDKISVNMKPTNSLNVSSEKGKNLGNEINHSNNAYVHDGARDVPVVDITRSSSEFVKRRNSDLEETTGVKLKENIDDVRHVASNIIRHRNIHRNILRRSKSPGTPVEDEHVDQDPFSPVEPVRYTVQESRNEPAECVEGARLMRCEEETRDTHTEKEIRSRSHSWEHREHRDQLTNPMQSNIGIKRGYFSPRGQPISEVYMRELSSVSDISMGDEYSEGDACQEALEPLLVRGSSRHSREDDLEDYPRDELSGSRGKYYDSVGQYSDRYSGIQREYAIPASRTERNHKNRTDGQPNYEVRGHRFDSPERPTHRFREEQTHWRYEKCEDVPRRRDTGQFQGAPPNQQGTEQMTAVQALQMQINAAVNPAHRAALVLALQAIIGEPMQSSRGEKCPQDNTVSDQQSDEVLSNRSYDDSVRERLGNRKVEFTVVLRDDDEKLLRKDKRIRNEDHNRSQRSSHDTEERYHNLSLKHRNDSNYKDSHKPRGEYSGQDDSRKHSRSIHVERKRNESNEKDNCGERHVSSKRNHRKSPPEGIPKKQKKSSEKRSKKYKDFHGRPLIKDRTNKTDPHSIPLENENGGDDPRRSVTPDPDHSPKRLKTLIWPPTPKQSLTISKKHKHKEHKRLKSVAVVPSSKEAGRAKEDVRHIPENDNESTQSAIMYSEDMAENKVRTSPDGTDKLESKELLTESTDVSDPTVGQTIEEYVDEVRKQNASSKRTKTNSAREDMQHACSRSPSANKAKARNSKCMESTSLECVTDRPSSKEPSPLSASKECATPTMSPSKKKEKKKSPDSKDHRDKSKDHEEHSPIKRSPQKRKLSDRSPELHQKYRHSDSDRELARHKRKYQVESESDIDDSDRENDQDKGSKLKWSGHFSRFNRDWRSRSRTFRHRFESRERTSLSHRFRSSLYSGNLGKPYGNQRSDTYRRTVVPPTLYSPFRGKAYCIDIMKEIKNSPSKSMAELGFENVIVWKDVHAGLAEIKAKMLSVEESSRKVRKASAALLVGPLLKIHKQTQDALQCIIDELGSRNAYERREMYLHRRKYEILMTDIRIHAEVLGKLIPPEEEKALLSEFIPNTTGIPRIEPLIELKVMNWVGNMDHSGMLKAWKEVFYKKLKSLRKKADKILFKKCIERRERWGRKYHVRSDSPYSRRKPESGSDRSPDTTGLDSGRGRTSDHPKLRSSPEVDSCPELGFCTPEFQFQVCLEPHSEIRLPTYYHGMQNPVEYTPSSPTAFRNPPEPVRKLLSSSQGLEDVLIPMPSGGGGDTVFFNIVDSLEKEEQRHDDTDEYSQPGPSGELPTNFVPADSSSVEVKTMLSSHHLSPDCSDIHSVSHISATPPCSSSDFADPHQPASAPVSYTHLANFYTSRVQRFASRTRMSPEAVVIGEDLLKRDADQVSKESKIHRSLTSAEEPSSEKIDSAATMSRPKSSSYSKKRHFLEKFQSDGRNDSSADALKQLGAIKIRDTRLNVMYDEFDKSCLAEDSTNIIRHGDVPSPSSSTTGAVQAPEEESSA